MVLYVFKCFLKIFAAEIIDFSLVQDMEQFYELWLKSQKNEKSDDVASQSHKENGKQIHMPTDYAEVTVSTFGHFTPLASKPLAEPFFSLPCFPDPSSLTRCLSSSAIFIFCLQEPPALSLSLPSPKFLPLSLCLTSEPEPCKPESGASPYRDPERDGCDGREAYRVCGA